MNAMNETLPVLGEWQDLAASPALARVDAASVGALNRIHAHRPPWLVRLGGQEHLLHWARPGREPFACHERYWFRLGPHRGRLGLDLFGQELALGGEREAHRLPLELRYVLLADLLFPLVERLEQATRLPFEWTPSPGEAAGEGGPQAVYFRLVRRDGARSCEGFVEFDDGAAFEALMAPLAALPRTPHPGRLDWLRLPVSFGLGSTRLPVGEMQAIRPGDIVRIDNQQHGGAALRVAVLVNGSAQRHLSATVDGARISIQPLEEPAMTHSPQGAGDAGATADAASAPIDRLDALEVVLRFEVGSHTLSLRELRSIGAGHVFELGEPLSRSSVRITAHGNLIGTGHLVAVGDRLGVRVSDFAAGPHE